jgi:hypothetical protein
MRTTQTTTVPAQDGALGRGRAATFRDIPNPAAPHEDDLPVTAQASHACAPALDPVHRPIPA